jgi:predicted GIY-YIG superfamily endonuclease
MNLIQDGEHALYRFFDDADQLLYVGLTVNLPTRLRDHHRDKAWWRDVVRMTATWYPTRADVTEAERLAIIDEKPLHNIQHNRGMGAASAMEPGREKVESIVRSETFLGSFFLSDERTQWQGYIADDLGNGLYLVATFSWWNGHEYSRHLVRVDDMTKWWFFSSDEAMRNMVAHARYRWDVATGKRIADDPALEQKMLDELSGLESDTGW